MVAKRDLSPEKAVARWLDSIRMERTEASMSSYYYRLKLFVEWCEREGVDSMHEIDGWQLDSYETHRRSKNPSRSTLKNELVTLRTFLEYCEKIEVVQDGVAEKIEVPRVPKSERSSEIKLDAADAKALLETYRSEARFRGTKEHAILEILWHTGARAGAVNSLDVGDLRQLDDGRWYLAFEHRPDTGTRLKKARDGERPVFVTDAVADAIQRYIDGGRIDTQDEYGREPLFTTEYGRVSPNTFRVWTYRATVPCVHTNDPCRHDRVRERCEFVASDQLSKCPSSRSPHQIRTGAITWMRDSGHTEEEVASRVNASVQTIRDHYDKQAPVEEMVRRRGQFAELDIGNEGGVDGGESDAN